MIIRQQISPKEFRRTLYTPFYTQLGEDFMQYVFRQHPWHDWYLVNALKWELLCTTLH